MDPESALLFLDEIQAIPEALANLRWLAEELPALRVNAGRPSLTDGLDGS